MSNRIAHIHLPDADKLEKLWAWWRRRETDITDLEIIAHALRCGIFEFGMPRVPTRSTVEYMESKGYKVFMMARHDGCTLRITPPEGL